MILFVITLTSRCNAGNKYWPGNAGSTGIWCRSTTTLPTMTGQRKRWVRRGKSVWTCLAQRLGLHSFMRRLCRNAWSEYCTSGGSGNSRPLPASSSWAHFPCNTPHGCSFLAAPSCFIFRYFKTPTSFTFALSNRQSGTS